MTKTIHMVRNVFNERSPREIKSIDNVFGDFLVNKGLYDEIEITKDTVLTWIEMITEEKLLI